MDLEKTDSEKLEKCAEFAYEGFYRSTGGTLLGAEMPMWDEMAPDHGLRMALREAARSAIEMAIAVRLVPLA